MNTLSDLAPFVECFTGFLRAHYRDDRSFLHGAIRYCLGGSGKKVRANLAMMVCQSYGQSIERAYTAAAALEMVHAYSLAHDDLPCMDNDDMRRGRASLHCAFDEATALLAGDAILTDAFRVLADDTIFAWPRVVSSSDRLRQITELARAAGGHGMVLGQSMDLAWTGRKGYSQTDLDAIHTGKTGALLGAACAMGAISAGASDVDVNGWRECGILTGLAFQAIDDTLDVRQGTGKSLGKDDAQGKLTYRTLFDCDDILELANDCTARAIQLIPTGCDSQRIVEFLLALIRRQT
jgi:geranylgeranyl pyrophosphate synthase